MKKKNTLRQIGFKMILILSAFSLISCSDKVAPEIPIVRPPKTDGETKVYIELDISMANQLSVTAQSDKYAYKLKTEGQDPYVQAKPIGKALGGEQGVLTFEYSAKAAVNFIQVFLGAPITEERSLKTGNGLKKTDSWTVWSLDLTDERKNFNWGNSASHFLRLDFGDVPGIEIYIRNIHFRERNDAEKLAAEEKENKRLADEKMNDNLSKYLNASYNASVTDVDVSANKVLVKGNYTASASKTLLCEIKPWQDITETTNFEGIELSQSPFSVELNRMDNSYDRLLSKWVVVQNNKIISHGRYADHIAATHAMTAQKPTARKGLGGFHISRGFLQDLDDLPITSVTVNIAITEFMYLDSRAGTIAHPYGGKTYYFAQSYIDKLDQTLRLTASKNIVVSAIILVQPTGSDSKIGDLLRHPRFEAMGGAFYTMPNMTTAESVNCYAAALDFLAKRYCRPDNTNGRIHHWIMHNEVDAGTTWTNMGANRPLYVFLDAYYKSMRLCFQIARKYDEHSEVLASFTHTWAKKEADYASLDLIKGLLKYSAAEGDFKWGLAYHPYPQDLNEPKTWLDNHASFSMATQIVTFKNLEVLDKWIKMPENKYLGTEKRTLWLSENGTNSRTYSAQDLAEQAAGLAYTWKKLKQLDGIDAFQWHNWIDNRGEFGLCIGLRRFPDDAEDPGGRKPVWYVFQAADTPNEDAVFEPYKSIIGISNWNEVLHTVY
ncbi:MAG: DUF5722 domain-containing protein [Dysgonamonadaceae bacterium]|jgi:hypothetical protein|nr:DUF5722 domain-containing protein [Dysgonamonadaceae bacterium]